MSLVQRTVCECDVCGHEWIAEVGGKLPKRCPSRKCRTTQWNSKAVVVKVVEPIAGHNPSPGLIPVCEVSREELKRMYPEQPIGPEDGDWPKPVAELADGEPYKRSEQAKKPPKSPYCRHGLAFHPGCS